MSDFNNINTLLFDLDGTLINTEKEFYMSFYEVLLNNYKIKIDEKIYKECELDINATLLDTLRNNYEIIKSVSNEKIMKEVFSCYTTKFTEVVMSDKTKEKIEWLKKLKNNGFTLGLVTTCMRKYLCVLIEKLNIYYLFDCIIAREDVDNLKPSGDAYLKALNILNKTAEESLAIEDSKRGIEAALVAKLKVVKVEEYTLVKFNDTRCIEFNSVDEFANKILKV